MACISKSFGANGRIDTPMVEFEIFSRIQAVELKSFMIPLETNDYARKMN